jgi:hypothetical protein
MRVQSPGAGSQDYSRVSFVIPFALGHLANSVMRFYRFWAGKKKLEAPEIKMAAKFKMAAKIWFISKSYKPSFYQKFYVKTFFSKIQDGAPIFDMAFFWHLFLEALAFVKNFKIQKFGQKFNSKWRPKLNLLVKTTNQLFSKKISGLF